MRTNYLNSNKNDKYNCLNTYNFRGSAVQNSSVNGKLKIKHPKLAWDVQDNYQPIYTFTVEEIVPSKSLPTRELVQTENTGYNGPIIYPNPSNGSFNIKSIEPITSIEIFSLNGNLINSNYYNDNRKLVNVEGLSNGVYIIVINKTQHFKLVIL